MAAATRKQIRRLPYALRIIRARPRLFSSFAIGIVVLALLPASFRLATRLLIAWDVVVALYLAFAFHLMSGSSIDRIRKQADVEDEGSAGILILTVAAALASLAAIVIELASSATVANEHRPAQLLLAIITILLSWAFIHTMFALHYAHAFYGQNDGAGGGLVFPGGEEPDYWDFVYFSFVIGMTSQVADVGISCKEIRRWVTAHGVIAFVFNVALLALTVNIAASSI